MSDKNVNIRAMVPRDEYEKFEEDTDNISRRVRELIKAWNDAEEEYELNDDFTSMELIALNTYKNAVEKHISLLESKRDKLQQEIDKIEDDEGEDVLVEISIDMKGKKL